MENACEASSELSAPFEASTPIDDDTTKDSKDVTSCGTKRKRGRPKKCDSENSAKRAKLCDEGDTSAAAMSASKRGRKRKELNYFQVENPEEKSMIKTEEDTDTLPSEKKQERVRKGVVLSQLLTSIQGKNASDVTGEQQQEVFILKRGRPKLSCELGKESRCAICQQVVGDDSWPAHKEELHYNLAWREGEPVLDITDEGVVTKTLTQLKLQKGGLKCRKCGLKTNTAVKFMKHLEECNDVISTKGTVTCAVCNESLDKSKWTHHKYRQHNNLAWREGDTPLNLDDQQLVVKILNTLYKAKKPLHCEKCGLQKKSVLGFLSHKSACQKSEEEMKEVKVACQMCGKKVLPVSMDSHMKMHQRQETKQEIRRPAYFDVQQEVCGKRRAAKQALQVINKLKGLAVDEAEYYISQCDFNEDFIKDLLQEKLKKDDFLRCLFEGCSFSCTDSLENLVLHLGECQNKPEQYFLCKLCLVLQQNEVDIQNHIASEHGKRCKSDADFCTETEQESADDETAEEAEKELKRLRMLGKKQQESPKGLLRPVKPLFLQTGFVNTGNLIFCPALGWTSQFCDLNFCRPILYDSLRNSKRRPLLDCDIIEHFLPKLYRSCDLAAQIIKPSDKAGNLREFRFKTLELFEVGDFYNGDATFYCGGPVNALAWLPTPHTAKNRQILAVTVINDHKSEYRMNRVYKEPCLVQFWDFGQLSFNQDESPKPSLLFAIALTVGPVWHFEWCPSGCLDTNKSQSNGPSRLGLLAAAASDSNVYIYCVDDLDDEQDRGLIYHGEPILKLQINSNEAFYPTKLSWTKSAGHRYLAAGYSNGLVAIFDLQSDSKLLKMTEKNSVTTINPSQVFQAHFACITGLTLNHLNGGNRWLFTSSLDKSMHFWDLTSTVKLTSFRKNGAISDGSWTTQWPVAILGDDETACTRASNAHSSFRSLRDFLGVDATYFTHAVSAIKSVCFSDWLNGLIHGSNGGEIMAQLTNRMLYMVDAKMMKKMTFKGLFSSVKLVSKPGVASLTNKEAQSYEEATEKYSLAFLDYNLDELQEFPNSQSKDGLQDSNMSALNIPEYNLQSVNKVTFNPNVQACIFYAAGYQSGVVRVKGLNFVRSLNKNLFDDLEKSLMA